MLFTSLLLKANHYFYFYPETLVPDIEVEVKGLKKRAKRDDTELYVIIAFKELINEAVSDTSGRKQ